jgi:putative nucleotidyltransferase with HDIG domain
LTQIQTAAETVENRHARVPFAILEALARTMSARDEAMHGHAERVRHYAAALAREVAIDDEQMVEAIEAAALLHDIGKLGIPDSVLNKPARLTPDEYEQVKQHVVIGSDLLSGVAFPGPLAVLVRHHHENWDGSGYPDRLHGNTIPLGARVLSVVDCYDALTSDRPYRRAHSHTRAFALIQEGRGTKFDPQVLDAFMRIVESLCASTEQHRTVTMKVETPAAWLRPARAV